MGKLIKINEAAELLGVDKQTVRSWSKKGKIETIVTPSGHRLYDTDVINEFLGVETNTSSNEKIYIYARVSTKKQAESGNLDRQITRLTEHAISKGYAIHRIYKEIASGINENRRELNHLLEDIKKHPNSVVIIEYKDRLARFGYKYLEKYMKNYNCKIEIVERKETNEEQELVEDLIAITTSFSARIYGKRGGKKVSKEIQTLLTKGE
ncbi:IS607 family transposase [Bacillus pacificus]|uniref:IS607 family transposase n=1 Tax=Bacillus pacificus TaxID=2026187 RepID=UPI0021CF7155|nr:IS607 family transposase [Bacillus pacificus]MCU5374678.1 IS607 family transposase [Bacillus pacificus]